MSRNPDVIKSNADPFALPIGQLDTLVDDRTISRCAPEPFIQCARRCYYVVYQSRSSQIELLRQMKTKKIIVKCLGDEIEKLYLPSYLEAGVWIFDLMRRKPCLPQQNIDANSIRCGMRTCEPGNFARSVQNRIKPFPAGTAHLGNPTRTFSHGQWPDEAFITALVLDVLRLAVAEVVHEDEQDVGLRL